MGSRVETLRFTVKASPSQHRRINKIIGYCTEMYNALLESWKGAYRWWREHNPDPTQSFPSEMSQSRYDLFKMFTQIRGEDPRWAGLDTRVGRGVIIRFDRARTGFYDRCKKGVNPGYPRFKPRARWRSITIPGASTSALIPPGNGRWWRLRVKGVPAVRFTDKNRRLQKALETGELVEVRLVRTPVRLELHVVFRQPKPEVPDSVPVNPVGIDKGLKNRLTLSDGTVIQAREPDLTAIKRKQRAPSRAEKGSKSRVKKREALRKAWYRESVRARQADFRLAHRVITNYDGVAVENLNIAGMLRSKRSSKKLSEQRWGCFDHIMGHKAEKAGIPYETVSPAYTSTDCSSCGYRQPMPLEVRVYDCPQCGSRLDRDVNAALNIRARAFPEAWGREGLPRCDARNKFLLGDRTTPFGVVTLTDVAEQCVSGVRQVGHSNI